ncbi:hypothetical protein BJY01DRAFT_159351 [Aspergillus pseudoustus]|uniref:Uncharacterized protein n=1 Tax=Aspergillus pseudoustus TaxID=1810923 RepID=A0ABR4KY05_9EURO
MRTNSGDDSSLASVDWLYDSVSKRRRHGMYFYRPPVWRYSSYQDGSSSPEMSEASNGSIEGSVKRLSCSSMHLADQQSLAGAVADVAPYTALDSDSDHETPLLHEDERSHGQPALHDCRQSSETPLECAPFHQLKPAFCTRLHSCKDIRLGQNEQWGIQEGSLVIGIGPDYTSLCNHERRSDEFEVASGDIYVVCSLYADLWALCAKVSFHLPLVGDGLRRLAFLPLCSVTLATNYSAFVQRCIRCSRDGLPGRKYPGNGLPVNPPRRSHSLTASKQIFESGSNQSSIPSSAQDLFRSLALRHTDDDFIPLDSTLEPILSPLTSRRRRLLRRIGADKTLSKAHKSGRQLMRRKHSCNRSSPLIAACRKIGSKSSLRRMRKDMQNSSPEGIHTLTWMSRKSR